MFNFDKQRFEMEQRRLELEYLKLEAAQQVAQTGNVGTNFLDALSETATEVWPEPEDNTDDE
jgi:hypothetical protein